MLFRSHSLAILASLPCIASGAIQANVVSGPTGTTATATETSPGSGVYDVVLTRPPTPGDTTDAVFEVIRTSASDKINAVVVNSRQSLATSRIKIGTSTAKINEVGSIKYGTGTGDMNGWAFLEELWTTFGTGDIDVSKIGVATIGGSLTGDVLVRAVENAKPEIVDLGVGGSITGDITVQDNTFYNLQGVITKLSCIEDAGKGPGTEAVAIRASVIKDIIVGGSFWGVIEGALPGNYATTVRRVDIGDGGKGSFDGIVRIAGFESTTNPYFIVRDDFLGTFAMSGAFDVDTNPARTPVIQTGVGGLQGQILINTSADELSSSWTAPIKIGEDGNPAQVVLTGTGYAASSTLGGGDAGLLPLGFHGADCVPQANATSNNLTSNITASFNGPVTYSSGSPLTVLQRKVGGTGSFSDLTSCVTFSRPGDDRDIVLAKPFWPVGDYEVSGTDGVLKNLVFGSAVGDVGFDIYRFSIRRACQGDLNGDNAVNTADLTLLLGAFGQSSSCGHERDLDGDLGVNTVDLTIFLGNFGNTCVGARPGAPVSSPAAPVTRGAAVGSAREASDAAAHGSTTESGRPGTPAPMPPVLAALGFTTIESYTTYVDGLTEEQLNAHILQLLQTIEALENQQP